MSSRQLHRNGVECIHGHFLHETCKDCRIAELEFKFSSKYWDEVGVEMMKIKAENQRLKEKLEAHCDHSELLREINELTRHNKVLQRADMHREKIWKKRVAKLKTSCTEAYNNGYANAALKFADRIEKVEAENEILHIRSSDRGEKILALNLDIAVLNDRIAELEPDCDNERLKKQTETILRLYACIAELEAKVKQLQTVTPESCSVLEEENQRLKEQLAESEQELTDLLESEGLLEQKDE